MADRPIHYWQARVVRCDSRLHMDSFAIHEVYFDETDDVVTYTEDALSPRAPSVEALRTELRSLLQQEGDIVCGDREYTYAREEIEEWLASLEQAVVDVG